MVIKEDVEIGGTKFWACHFTGAVESAHKQFEAKVSGASSGGGGTIVNGNGHVGTVRVSVQGESVLHTDLFLRADDGAEKHFKFEGFDVPCRDGHVLTIVWAGRADTKTGCYLGIYNHNLKQTTLVADQTRFSDIFAAHRQVRSSRLLGMPAFIWFILFEASAYWAVPHPGDLVPVTVFAVLPLTLFVAWVNAGRVGRAKAELARKFIRHPKIAALLAGVN